MPDRTEMNATAATFNRWLPSASKINRWLPSARKIWLNLHLWLGLTAGFVLSLIGLSGALLVFYGQILTMEAGHRLFDVDGPTPVHLAIDEWIASAHQSYGEITAIDFVMGPGFGFGGGNAVNLGAEGPDGKHL